MAETFGETSKLATETTHLQNRQWLCKYTSGSAGTLASISIYMYQKDYATNAKCAIFDSSFNLLTNGKTEAKALPLHFDDWAVFNFPIPPTVEATTLYCLAWWTSSDTNCYRADGTTNQRGFKAKTYNDWDDPLVPQYQDNNKISIYATYEEAPPPAAKTLVQAALISIPPLIVLPTLSQILKVTGG